MTPNVSFSYDNDGNRTSMSDGTGTSSYSYDSLSRLTQSTTGAGQTVSYGYDLAGNLTSLTYPGNVQVTRAYDPANRLTGVSDWLSHTISFSYDANSNLTSETFPNTTAAALSYNNADQLTQIQDSKAGSPFWTFGYGRDNAGQLSSASDPLQALSHAFGYDALNRLTSDQTSSTTTSWSYDAGDNLTGTADTASSTASTLSYDAAHQLTGLTKTLNGVPVGATTFQDNANGDRTQQVGVNGATTTYGNDQADRLTNLTTTNVANPQTAQYAYNGDGLRMSKTVATTTTQQTWDLAEGLPLLVPDGTTKCTTGPSRTVPGS